MQLGQLFTYLISAAGTTYGWLNPFFGLMVYTSLSILRPTHLWFWVDWQFRRFNYTVALSMIIGWLMNGLGDWSGLRKIKLPLWGLGIYMGMGVFTYQFVSINQRHAWRYLYPQLTIGLMALMIISLVRTQKQIITLAWVIMLSLGYMAWNFNVQYLDNPFYLRLRGFGGVDNNGVAMMMVCGVPLGFMMGVNAKNPWAKGVCFLSTLTLTHVVLFSDSRGGMLGLCIIGFALFLISLVLLPNKGRTLILACLALAAALHMAGEGVREHFLSIFLDKDELDASAASRYSTWAGAWACMKDHPLGLGPRGFNLVSHQYGLSRNKSVHNLFLQTGADYGFLGLFGMCLFYFGTMIKTFFMTLTVTARRLVWPRYFGQMVALSLAGFTVCSTFIGMESVEIAYIISLLGLCTVAYVDRVSLGEDMVDEGDLLEMQEVPDPEEYAELVPA